MRHRLIIPPVQHLAMAIEPGNAGAIAQRHRDRHRPDTVEQPAVEQVPQAIADEVKAKLATAGYQNFTAVKFDDGLWSVAAKSPQGSDINLLVRKLGPALTTALGQAGVKVRMG